jgi:hypothetical protein
LKLGEATVAENVNRMLAAGELSEEEEGGEVRPLG